MMNRSATRPAHIRRFDPHWIADEVSQRTGVKLKVQGVASLGESGGAVFVQTADGQNRVITGSQGTPIERLRCSAAVLGSVRSASIPVPRIYDVVALPDGFVALVQERLPGKPMRGRLNPDKMQTLIEVNERFADVLAGQPDVPVPPMNLRKSGESLPKFGWDDGGWHETLRSHSRTSRQLLDQIESIGVLTPDEMAGDDLLHLDLNGDNILLDDDGQLSGVVDWNWGVARGDRALALVHLRLCMAWGTMNPDIGSGFYESMALLDAHLAETVDQGLLQMYSAHMTLHMVSWAIQQWPPNVVDAFIRTGKAMLR